jgi:uncharacterized protein (DUF1499 family)
VVIIAVRRKTGSVAETGKQMPMRQREMRERSDNPQRKLAPCPTSPNCVSSQNGDESHAIKPISYTSSVESARQNLLSVINSMKRSDVITVEGPYIHATFTSRIFRFVDDVEFLFDDVVKIIHVKSASRVGYFDFGVNRKRVEEIRSRFNEALFRSDVTVSGDSPE